MGLIKILIIESIPNPIGAPIIVITSSPPIKKVPKADKKPKNGTCHKMLPNTLIILCLN